MEQNEIDVDKHFRTLDRKLDGLAAEGKITKEELMATRLLGEVKGKIGNKGVNINMDLRHGETCQACGTIRGPAFELKDLKTDPKAHGWLQLTQEEIRHIEDRRLQVSDDTKQITAELQAIEIPT